MIKPGQKAPSLSLTTIDGQEIALAEMWREGRAMVLVFLRHLG